MLIPHIEIGLYPALSWWCVLLHLHGLGQVIWGVVHKFSGAVSVAQVLSLAILASIPLLSVSSASEQVIQDLLFPDDDKVQRELNQARARKVWNWVRHPKTPAELLVVCLRCHRLPGCQRKPESL